MQTNSQQNETLRDSDAFMSQITEQVGLCRRLKRMTAGQRELITQEDTSRLLSLLSDRRKLTDELAGLYGSFGPLQLRWQQIRESLSSEQREEAGRLIDELRGALREILAADSEDAKLLEVRKARVSNAMSELPVGQAMLSAYGRPPMAAPRAVGVTDEEA
jgi:hypothetical protein